MSDVKKGKAVELEDDEAEHVAGGWYHIQGDFIQKKCGQCQTIYDWDAARCPNCNYDKGEKLAGGTCVGSFPNYSGESPR